MPKTFEEYMNDPRIINEPMGFFIYIFSCLSSGNDKMFDIRGYTMELSIIEIYFRIGSNLSKDSFLPYFNRMIPSQRYSGSRSLFHEFD